MVKDYKPIDTRTYVNGNDPSLAGATTPSPSSTPGPSFTPAPGASSSSTPGSTSTPAPDGGSGSSVTEVKTGNTVPISSEVPALFKAGSFAELIPELKARMPEFKPLTEDEVKKLRKKQKIAGIISGVSDAAQALSNLYFTTHSAPNMYDGNNNMSAKLRARIDKEKAERDANADRYFNYAMMIGQMQDADRQAGLDAWKTEQTLARTDRDHDDDMAFRKKDFDERVRQWQEGFNRDEIWHQEEAARWERQFAESVRQFNVKTELERRQLALTAQRLAYEMQQGQMTFNLGSGQGNVTLSVDKLNAQTIARIYSTLPTMARTTLQNMEYDKNGKFVGYRQPTTEEMLIAIGTYCEGSPATQSAIRQVAGQKTGDKPKGY